MIESANIQEKQMPSFNFQQAQNVGFKNIMKPKEQKEGNKNFYKGKSPKKQPEEVKETAPPVQKGGRKKNSSVDSVGELPAKSTKSKKGNGKDSDITSEISGLRKSMTGSIMGNKSTASGFKKTQGSVKA